MKEIAKECIKWTLWIMLLAGALFTGWKQTAAIPKGCKIIMNLEFAHSEAEARDVLHGAHEKYPDIQSKVIKNTLYDNVFILLYTSIIIFSFHIFWSKISITKVPGPWYILLFAPGMCDLIENGYIMLFSTSAYAGDLFCIYLWVVRVKWVLAIPLALMVLAVLIHLLLIIIDFTFRALYIMYAKIRAGISGT